MPPWATLRHALGQAARLDRAAWGDVGRAAIELGIARVRHGRDDFRLLLPTLHGARPAAPPLAPRDRARVERTGRAIARAARWLPFRTDCLVQALAAQRWLERQAIATRLTVGVRKKGELLDAHAWLEAGDQIVTGGDIADYRPFTEPAG